VASEQAWSPMTGPDYDRSILNSLGPAAIMSK
jgi:hypothetical protein